MGKRYGILWYFSKHFASTLVVLEISWWSSGTGTDTHDDDLLDMLDGVSGPSDARHLIPCAVGAARV